MSDPIDIKALDEYLKKGSEVSQRYRELGSDVPPELDRRVLAAARAAVANEGARRSRSWLRWSAPVALAASVVLVVTVVLEGGVQDETVAPAQAPAKVQQEPGFAANDDKAAYADEERKLADKVRQQQGVVSNNGVPVYSQTVPEPAREFVPPPEITLPEPVEASAAKAEAEHVSTVAAPAAAEQPAQSDQALAGSVANVPAPAAAQPAEADSSAELQEVAVTGTRARRATGRTAGPRNTISTGSLRGESRPASDEQADRSDPQAWLEEIRELRRAGKADDADREWLRFREAFPDFAVADDDIARKKP